MAELVREIHIKASPEVIFGYLTDPAKYIEWGGSEAELDPRPGGTYRVLMGGTHQSAGEFLEVVPNERVLFSFGWEEPGHPIPGGSTQVEIRLVPDEEGTTVRLTHSGLPADAVSDHTGGWDHYLDRLEVAATGGDPGPDGMPGTASEA
jgi:uncharacterized protein YndB with AHSA1/START domain